MAKRPEALKATPAEYSSVTPMRVVFPHGFIEADGTHRVWLAGQLVDDAAELGLLRARGVELQEK